MSRPAVLTVIGALTMLFALPAQPKAFAGGFLGEPISVVEHSGFFQWFALEKTAAKPGPAGSSILIFQPSGPRFHKLARVEATIRQNPTPTADASQRVVRIDLVLSRAFIDSSTEGVFASDIASSFLRAAVAKGDTIETLAREIEASGKTSQPIIVGSQSSTPTPTTPTPAFLVYLGKQHTCKMDLTGSILALVNSGSEFRASFGQRPWLKN